MSFLDVSLKRERSGQTVHIHPGSNIIGRYTEGLGLNDESKLSRKQLDVVLNILGKAVTVERLGANTSKLNGIPIPKNQVISVSDGDIITLVVDDHPCRFRIQEIPFSSDPLSTLSAGEAQFGVSSSPTGQTGANYEDDLDFDEEELKELMGEDPRISDIDGESDGELGQRLLKLWPEDFSDESDDLVGSGIDEPPPSASEPSTVVPTSDTERATKRKRNKLKNEMDNEDREVDEADASKNVRKKAKTTSKRIAGSAGARRKTLAAEDSVGMAGELVPAPRHRKLPFPKADQNPTATVVKRPRSPAQASGSDEKEKRRVTSTKRRVTGYGLFASDMREQLKKEYPRESAKNITKLVKRRWENLDVDQMTEYQNRASEQNARSVSHEPTTSVSSMRTTPPAIEPGDPSIISSSPHLPLRAEADKNDVADLDPGDNTDDGQMSPIFAPSIHPTLNQPSPFQKQPDASPKIKPEITSSGVEAYMNRSFQGARADPLDIFFMDDDQNSLDSADVVVLDEAAQKTPSTRLSAGKAADSQQGHSNMLLGVSDEDEDD
ncbi:hypothetical protein DFS34DRAFT_645074 [Phlyctochytrium arcticum]|nr:hypothetical protein DFS34DRAFT_645074 [Phlyctochytrium arcticum]